jgi:hypothetical protein
MGSTDSKTEEQIEKENDNQYYGSAWYSQKYTTDSYGNEYKKSNDDQYKGSSWYADKYGSDD